MPEIDPYPVAASVDTDDGSPSGQHWLSAYADFDDERFGLPGDRTTWYLSQVPVRPGDHAGWDAALTAAGIRRGTDWLHDHALNPNAAHCDCTRPVGAR